MAGYWSRVIDRYLTDIGAYFRSSVGISDFLKIMRIRMALSKIGFLVCHRRIVWPIALRDFDAQPIFIRSHTTDISVLGEIVVSKGYAAVDSFRSNGLVVDLGANTGLFTRWILARCPQARVIAVEPEPGNLDCLAMNVEGRNVRIVRAAIGAWVRDVELHTSTGEHGFTMMGAPKAGRPAIKVPVVTMASILDGDEPIDLLKVDIEGAEAELFSNCAGWIGRVKTILVECHTPYKLADLERDLRKAGADFKLLDVDKKPEWGFEVGLLESRSVVSSTVGMAERTR